MSKTATTRIKQLTLLGSENLPTNGGFLILPSRLNITDIERLEHCLSGRKIVYVIEDGAPLQPLTQSHLEQENVNTLTIAISATDTSVYRKAIQSAIDESAIVIFIRSHREYRSYRISAAISNCASKFLRLDLTW